MTERDDWYFQKNLDDYLPGFWSRHETEELRRERVVLADQIDRLVAENVRLAKENSLLREKVVKVWETVGSIIYAT